MVKKKGKKEKKGGINKTEGRRKKIYMTGMNVCACFYTRVHSRRGKQGRHDLNKQQRRGRGIRRGHQLFPAS